MYRALRLNVWRTSNRLYPFSYSKSARFVALAGSSDANRPLFPAVLASFEPPEVPLLVASVYWAFKATPVAVWRVSANCIAL